MQTNWKDLLKRLKYEHMRQSTPRAFEASGGYTMALKPFDDRTANGLTNCIETFVKCQGGYANRINTTGTMRKINGEMKWTAGNSNKGAADIRILFNGRSLDVEVKIGADKMSDAQIKEKAKVEAAGGLYYIAKDFPSFLEYWQSIGFDLPHFEPIAA